MKIISIKPHLKLSLFSSSCAHVLRNNLHPAYSDPGVKSNAPDASAIEKMQLNKMPDGSELHG